MNNLKKSLKLFDIPFYTLLMNHLKKRGRVWFLGDFEELTPRPHRYLRMEDHLSVEDRIVKTTTKTISLREQYKKRKKNPKPFQ